MFAANDVTVMIDEHDGYTPTPVISHAILTYNKGRTSGLADGVVITPSHNPPEDGGFKYNPPNGGPADTDITAAIETAANAFLESGLAGVKRVSYDRARKSACDASLRLYRPYVADLANVVDMDAIRSSGVKIGIDPLGGAGVHYWQPIIERYRLAATIVNDAVDPTFRFMTADWDGKIRMDCSSPYAMARLIGMRSKFDVAFANDTDADRHGIVTGSNGLMNPNHYLATCIAYLFENRPDWSKNSAVGKTIVSSAIIDRVAAKLGRKLVETPVGFKWFVDGLIDGSFGFVGEESAGASFLRRDGSVWTTDKDGLIPGLLAAEITARTGHDPSQLFKRLTDELGLPFYERIDAPATAKQKNVLKALSPERLGHEGTRRRARQCDAHQGSRQRPIVRRDQGDDERRLVRRAAVRHRRRLQDLRGEFSERRALAADSTGSAGGYFGGIRRRVEHSASNFQPGVVVEEAGHLMLGAGCGQHRRLGFAAVHHIAAAGMEGAARWRIDRAWHVAVDQRLERFGFGIGDRNRGQQRLRIGMARMCEQFGLLGDLDNAPEIHHGDAVADMRDHRKIVRDEQI